MMRAPRLAAVLCAAAALAPGAPALAQPRAWPSMRPPPPLDARAVTFPPYAFRTLPNGLQVIAVPHHEEPAVSVRLIVRAGSAKDPEGKPGTASLVASLLDQGTATRDAEQIANTIDSIGGLLGTGAGADLSYVNGVVMKDSLDLGLDLVADLAQHPAFAPQEIERQRQQVVSGLEVSYDDPSYIADTVFDRLVYGFHPYGRPQNGTPASVAAITRDDLVAFHRTWFGANNAILAIVGDVGTDEAFAGAERAFGHWGRVTLEKPPPLDLPPPTRRLVVIDRPDAVQTEIRVGNLALARKQPDYLALDLATKILGGEGANRLHRVLRTERGLTYGASADFNAMHQTGEIVAQTNTRSATTGETLRLMVDQIWKLQNERVSERELGDAQAYLTGSFPLTVETPSQIALQILNAVFYGLDLTELQTYRARVNAITVDDIQRVARAYLHPDRLTIVLVGNASAFVQQLAGAGFDEYDRIALADLDVSTADLRRAVATPAAGGEAAPGGPSGGAAAGARAVEREAAAADGCRDTSPRALLECAAAAKGGLDRLKRIRTVHARSTTRVESPQGVVDVPTETSIAYPDRFRLEARTPAGPLVQVYAAGHYWVHDSRGTTEAPVPVRDEVHERIARDIVPLLIRAAAGGLPVQAAPAPSDATLAAVRVQAESAHAVTLFIDRRTGLIAREQYLDSADPSQVVEEVYSDYRPIDGIQVAFRAEIHQPGAPPVVRLLHDIEFNVPFDPAIFAKPS
ncbi:MAG TPA: insulinase family protein [Vicinamibacterales bacterium]|nr:insulinase family protein [Vicinamibacterales bacterium]